jgi:hypothetical protein
MKNLSNSLRCAIALALATSSSCALAQLVNPNGFPSGPHYNLNIHGKKAEYNCTPVVYDAYGNPVYGNSVFVPEFGEDIQILMKSGRKGGKASELYQEFRATDACAPAFDGDPIEIELPPNENGYRAYARALAKPGGTATFTYGGSLFSAQDEYGNDLVDLGLVTPGGVASTGESLVRSKGRSVAIDITGLFLWSGTVCTIDFLQAPLFADPMDANYRPLCWIDTDGVVGFSGGDTFAQPTPDGLGGFTCGAGATLIWVKVACITYTNEWIFNIAELVASDWLMDNDGSKLIQIRFYPVQ